MLRVILLIVMLQSAVSKIGTTNINLQKEVYERNLNTSLVLDKEDKSLRSAWALDFQVKRINVTAKYRTLMSRHHEHNFRITEDNTKWSQCIFLHRKQIRKAEKQYYTDEGWCLISSIADDNKTKAVEQMERESRKWRKGYKYLVHTCDMNHPKEKDAATICLIRYMEKDNYSDVIKRLMVLQLEAMGELFLQLSNSVKDLEQCLNEQLSTYLDKVREIMETLNKCYSVTATNTLAEIQVDS